MPGDSCALADAQVAGHTDLYCTSVTNAALLLQQGRIRPIGVTSIKRSPVLPNLPTAAEAGVPGYEFITWHGILAPKATPHGIVNKLNSEINRIMQLADVKERLDALSLEYTPNTPAQFAAAIKKEIPRYAEMVKQSGAKAD